MWQGFDYEDLSWVAGENPSCIFNGDMFAPAEELLKFADDPRVFRVLQVAAEKVAKLNLK